MATSSLPDLDHRESGYLHCDRLLQQNRVFFGAFLQDPIKFSAVLPEESVVYTGKFHEKCKVRQTPRLALLLSLLLMLSGCTTGLLYTNVVEPYSLDFRSTPVCARRCEINAHKIREPVSRFGLSAEWDTAIIQQAARQAGIRRIDFAEKRTLMLFFNVYRRSTLIVYGE